MRGLANDHLFCCPTFGVEQFVAIRSKNSPTLCLCVFLLVWWSCQLPLAALQITKSSLTCWLPSQRRFMPCQTQQYQTATSRPWLHCVTWRTESWWWTSDGPNISQVGKWAIKIKHVRDMHACCLNCWINLGPDAGAVGALPADLHVHTLWSSTYGNLCCVPLVLKPTCTVVNRVQCSTVQQCPVKVWEQPD